VPFAEGTADQARRIIEEQLKPAPPPHAQALPEGTVVRTVFITARNEAFVDLSPEVTTRHTGGSLDELFSVYTIVNALTVNLPAIERVQILVDGREVDSLAGHIDLRRPLSGNLTWVARPEGAGDGPQESPGNTPSPAQSPAPPPAGPETGRNPRAGDEARAAL
jgi:hypothetical protein